MTQTKFWDLNIFKTQTNCNKGRKQDVPIGYFRKGQGPRVSKQCGSENIHAHHLLSFDIYTAAQDEREPLALVASRVSSEAAAIAALPRAMAVSIHHHAGALDDAERT